MIRGGWETAPAVFEGVSNLGGRQVAAKDCGAPEFLDIFNDELCSGFVADVRRLEGVIHRIGKVA